MMLLGIIILRIDGMLASATILKTGIGTLLLSLWDQLLQVLCLQPLLFFDVSPTMLLQEAGEAIDLRLSLLQI